MTELKDLKRKRSSYKGRFTTFGTYVSSLNVSEITSCQVMELQLRINKLETLFDEFSDIQLQIECLSEDPENDILERNCVESQYYGLLAQGKTIVDTFIKSEKDSNKSSHSSRHQLVKLPTIKLPRFSGSYDNWLEFRDTFFSLIHDNDDIDEINKFHYLRSSLEGSAAVIIQSIEFSANNYTTAWELLCDRFDNKRLLINNHVSALFNLEPITKESSTSIKCIIDQVTKNIRALSSLGEPVQHWDTLLIHIISKKLDLKTFREWEEHKGNLDKSKSITFEIFIEFLRNRSDLVETLELSRLNSSSKPITKHKTLVTTSDNSNNNNNASSHCPKCNQSHNLYVCPQFLALSVNERMSLLPNYKICYNCFRQGHLSNQCKKPGCKTCKRKHHTLIHNSDYKLKHGVNNSTIDQNKAELNPSSLTDNSQVALLTNIPAHSHTRYQSDVLLSTALIRCYDVNNKEHIARALLDSGSSSCIMTERLFKKLNLPFIHTNQSIQGINDSLSPVRKMCRIHIQSLCESYSNDLMCFVLPTITDNVPARQVSVNIPSDIKLADPYFHTPAAIDLIIGADVFWTLLSSNKIILGNSQPILYETRLGWVICGPIISDYNFNRNLIIKCNFTQTDNNCHYGSSRLHDIDDIQNQLIRFWQTEEVCHESSILSHEERLCEEHFIKNTSRLSDGRFCVKIPLKESSDSLGDSFSRAKRCFIALERRNFNQPSLDKMYKEFMSEYISLGHMSECVINEAERSYYIPHHGVLRESSLTTKLRVVFNASTPTTSGISFNQIQMVGPTVQDDLTSILLRFRMYKYVLSADVEKMYRQVSVHPSDRHLQQIIWRDGASSPLKTYKLNTVTYGTASAPYLATRCLRQIGLDSADQLVAEVILHDLYVDDLLTGTDHLDQAQELRRKVTDALAAACMHLRKWKSNEPTLVSDENNQFPFLFYKEGDKLNKTLGLSWQTNTDNLYFPITLPEKIENTKRNMLAIIARIFDPLGLLAPCVIKMKIMLQRLWLDGIKWDDQLKPDTQLAWVSLIKLLPAINDVHIPRRVVCDQWRHLEFHIFNDASERAFGSCLYLRSSNEQGDVYVQLLMAKSRVAPIKPMTIPRMELCACVLGANLYKKVAKSLRQQPSNVVFWTDSMIVLGWLKMLPIKLNTFVRNRVAEIQEKTQSCSWRHIPTHENPADLITRGAEPTAIQSLDLWWFGPSFLKQHITTWPSTVSDSVIALPEIKTNLSLHTTHSENYLYSSLIKFDRFSNFLRLQRAVCYVFRFIKLCKRISFNNTHFSHDELQCSLNLIIIQSQRESFPEYQLLLNNKEIPCKNHLLKFNVFLDENKIMRVGGRLHNSEYSFEKKHPILLQSTNYFVKLLFRYEHIRLMHSGPQLLLATIRETYWPLGGRNLARACYRQCIRCKRLKGQTVVAQMGNLPLHRCSPADFPFQNVGVDYAGPIFSASRQGRGCRLIKVYIVIFVCFSTKAIHLELVGDLTSNNYLQALRRFISRRGKPLNIYSDNGSTFVGACKELSDFLNRECDSIPESMAHDGIKTHFIPAYAPNFGGLWEAGVKSTKFHLNRVLGNCNLTYEELNSVLIQIEALLNSRPLTPLSTNPEDLLPLTPGHFLIGRPLTSLPVKDLRDHSHHHLARYQRIEQLRQHFWARWHKEYVSELQLRVKWKAPKDALKLNSLVVIKDDNLPPMKWKLGRVVALHPGTDNICRVADIKTATGVVRRAISKICPLLEESC